MPKCKQTKFSNNVLTLFIGIRFTHRKAIALRDTEMDCSVDEGKMTILILVPNEILHLMCIYCCSSLCAAHCCKLLHQQGERFSTCKSVMQEAGNCHLQPTCNQAVAQNWSRTLHISDNVKHDIVSVTLHKWSCFKHPCLVKRAFQCTFVQCLCGRRNS